MAVETPPEPSSEHRDIDAGVIEDARQRQRGHRKIWMVLLASAIAAAAVGYIIAPGPPAASHRAARPRSSSGPGSPASAHVFTPTRSPDLIQPTTLATLPDGRLLILDSSRDQILELRPDGALSAFAGDGHLGFAGDGGPAKDAELDLTYFSSAGITVTPNGSVYFLDDGNCRIRQIDPAGIIRTVLRVPLIKVGGFPHGTTCPVAGVAVSPGGSVYVATDSEIERLSASGHLVWVAGSKGSEAREPAHLTPSNVVFSPGSLAFSRGGDLDISDTGAKVIYELTPTGKLTDLGPSYATQLTPDPNGQILAGTHGGEIEEVSSKGINPFYDVVPKLVRGINWPQAGFQENGIAATKAGTIYVDNARGNGYGDSTVLVRISPDKEAALAPIHTPLAATLPKVGAPGFPRWLYPPSRASRSDTLTSCPSESGLQRFTPQLLAEARKIARTYLSNQFASDIAVTDRSWWPGDFDDYAASDDLGRHSISREAPASRSPIAAGLAQACGRTLVRDSVTVTVGKSGYSDFVGTLYLIDRDGHPLVYDVR